MLSPGHSQHSGNIGPEDPSVGEPLGVMADGCLLPGPECCCCPKGQGLGWQAAEGQVWSPRCSPPGFGPLASPVPPGGPALRPQVGAGCAPSPTRGSQRLHMGTGLRAGGQFSTVLLCLPSTLPLFLPQFFKPRKDR